jgi:hypothetical protein
MPCQQLTHACVKAHRVRVHNVSLRRRKKNGIFEKLIGYRLVIVRPGQAHRPC